MNGASGSEGPLEHGGTPPDVAPHEEPPRDFGEREERWTADHTRSTRDMSPALGTRGEPARWRRAAQGATVAVARRAWGDARWSFLFKRDTRYAAAEPRPGELQRAARGARYGPEPETIIGPLMKKPVWTWEVPLYFWIGGIAAGSSFVASAMDLAGDRRSAATARKVAIGAVLLCPPLLIADLGRPARFANMLRVFKPRSPMNLGAWCLTAFGALGSAAVGADLLGRPRTARTIGHLNALVGGYLGSYTGVLLGVTAVPLWARSRLFLGPIFVATATATGAATCRLVLVASGLPLGHRTRTALGNAEAGAILAELALSSVNERRLGMIARPLREGKSGRLFRAAKWSVRIGLALRALRRPLNEHVHNFASVLYLLAGLGFRFAWVEAGKESAGDDEAVTRMARGRGTLLDELGR